MKYAYLLILFLLFVFPQTSNAQESIQNFDVNLTAHQNGDISIDENINYDFGSSYRHGIYRYIPLVSKVGDLYRIISVKFASITRDSKDENFSVSNSAKQTEVKIGNPDKTISGLHRYKISYNIQNGIGSNYTDHDEIFWNVTGNDWEVPIQNSVFTIKTDFNIPVGQTICFTGSLGSKESNCNVEDTDGGKKVTMLSPLNSGEGLTVVSSFPVGTFPKSTLQKDEPNLDPDFINFLKVYVVIWITLNLLLSPYVFYKYVKGKSKERFGKPTVNFDFPQDEAGKKITPAEAGIVDNTKLEKDDVIATIFDLAIRKFIKIEEVKNVKKFAKDTIDYKLIKLKDYDGDKNFEKELMESFFKSGNGVLLKDLQKDFYKIFEEMESSVFASLIKRNIYKKNPKYQMSGLLTLGIVLTVTLNFILGPLVIYLSRKLNGRTEFGDKIDWEVSGLKIFLSAMGRNYKWQAKSLITIEKYIPFAIALGLQKEFMDQLKLIYPNYKPTWYSGSSNFYSSYPLFLSSTSSNITTSAPSSSSGFSGGGFSGGGGGGGGGGSW